MVESFLLLEHFNSNGIYIAPIVTKENVNKCARAVSCSGDTEAIVMKLVGVEIEKVEEWDNALFFLGEIPNSGE